MPTLYQTDPYGRTRQYGPSTGPVPPADLYDVPEDTDTYYISQLLNNLKNIDLGPPVQNIGKFLGAAAGIPGVELPEEAAGPTGPPSFMQEWGSNIARNLRSTYGAPQPSVPQPQPPKPGLASVMEQEPSYPGWKTVPGTQAFSGGPGRYRMEPGSLESGSSGSLGAFMGAKYGPGYAAERTVGTPEYEAGSAASLGYSNLVDKILKAAEAQGRPELLGKPLEDVFTGWGELGKSEADILASREARAEKEAQRRENAWLLEQYLGGAGAPPGGGVSEKTLTTGTKLAHERRAQESAERADRRLDLSERRGLMAGPSRSDIITRAQRILLESGRTVKKTPDGDLVVYQNNKPVQGGEQLLASALKEAERQIRSGAP